MARATGCFVMTGDRDGEYRMAVEFLGQLTMMPRPLRTQGYYSGFRTSAEMIEGLRGASSNGGTVVEGADVTGSVGNLGAGFSGEEIRSVESQSSTESPKPVIPRALSPSDTGEEGFRNEVLGEERYRKEKEVLVEENTRKEVLETDVSGRSDAIVGLGPYLGPFRDKPAKARAMGRAPIGSLRRDQSKDEVETEIVDVQDYFVFGDDRNVPVSLYLLPLELEERESIGVSVSSTEFSLLGKSNGMDIMRPISAWKLEFLQDFSSHFLVKITQKNGAKWVKLDKPRSDYKETAADVYFVANVLSVLKKEPQASEDILWNLLQGEIASESFRDKLRMLYPVIEQFIIVDPVLKEAGAQKTLQSLLDRAKETNSGKRVLIDTDVFDEVENRPAKKLKSANVVLKSDKAPKVGMPSIAMLGEESHDEIMGEFESDEENSEEDDSGEEFGDSFCSFCDDGGDLLCCDGPCMRTFHASEEDGIQSNCKSLGLSKAAVARMVGRWLCKNCKYGRHQCYICGKLGASSSDEALGGRQEVFMCNVACCGKFYHPKCIASKLTISLSERETFAKNIQAGKESFTCPLHTCKACGKGEDREEENLSLVKCRRCPKAWHKKCLPRTMPFEVDARRMGVPQRAWSFGNKQQQSICYCTDHELIEYLGTPRRDHLDFGRPPQVAQRRNKVQEVTKEPARNEAETPPASPIAKSVGKKYPSPDLYATDRLPGSSSVPSSRPSSSVPLPRSIISKDSAKRFEEVAIRTVDSIVKAVRQKVTEDSIKVKQEKNLPNFYKPRKMKTEFMKMGVLRSILEAAKNAVVRIRQDKIGDARIICDRKNVVDAMHEEDRLRTYLAPTLFGRRYTSYGRHFTKVQKLEKVVEILQPFILERDTIVDFSCGDNTFCKLLREALPVAGKTNCQFKNFDIFPSKDSFGFEQKNWLDVGMRECGPGDNLVIGLNPPFAFMDKFVSHALDMNPRLLVLIVPPMKKNLEHLGYVCLVDDGSLMAEKSFYLPGSVNEKNTECLEQGNNVAPHFFIYGSKKFYGHRKSGAPEEGPSTANPISTSRIEKPVKPPPPSEPTVNIFIPPAQQRGPQPVPNPDKRRVAPHQRDPRLQRVQVPNRVPRPAARASREDGEFLSPRQRHVPSNNPSLAPYRNHPRPTWRFDDRPLPPPPPPLPEAWSIPNHYHQRPRQPEQHGFYPREVGPHHHPLAEYSPFEPGLFPRGGTPPFRHTGFGLMRPPQNDQFRYQRPSPSRNPNSPPEDDDESFGGWISH